MTLMDAILQRVHSGGEVSAHSERKYSSPPPEIDELIIALRRRKKTRKYRHVPSRVDSSPLPYDCTRNYRRLQHWSRQFDALFAENVQLLTHIKRAHWMGKVDSHWKTKAMTQKQYYKNRVDFLKRVYEENQYIYQLISRAVSRVPSTAWLRREWCRNRENIVNRALLPFVLFPPVPQEDMEDPAFIAPPGVKRPRAYMTVGLRDCAVLGELCMELFTDVCPQTCQLFTELLDGDTLGHGYVGTCFFRKVPGLYWSGGDVIHNNGFGCYAQRGRVQPIGAENYHFPHSMAGLLSMRVTCDDEVCGIFNITFKPLPQFDLHNVVFGRIIRPSLVYDTLCVLGSALSSHPLVEVRATRRRLHGRWVHGEPNTRMENTALHQTRQSLARRRRR